jgi:hypothetical protein
MIAIGRFTPDGDIEFYQGVRMNKTHEKIPVWGPTPNKFLGTLDAAAVEANRLRGFAVLSRKPSTKNPLVDE